MKKIFPIIGIILGVALLILSGYLYFTKNETVFRSENITINRPQTTVTKSFTLNDADIPYEITMDVNYEVAESPEKDLYPLFRYEARLTDRSGTIIEEKSSTFTHTVDSGNKAEDTTGNKTATVDLFTLKDIQTGTYVLTITVSPLENIDPIIDLKTFSYQIISNIASISPLLPVFGLLVVIASYFLLPKEKKQDKKDEEESSK